MAIKEETVTKQTLEYFNGDELATNVWVSKYALKEQVWRIFRTNTR
jgi:hypothetical protein